MNSTIAFLTANMGGGEVLVVLLVLLLLFGARRLPELARALGRAVGELRRGIDGLSRDVVHEASSLPPSEPPINPAPTPETSDPPEKS